METPTPTVEPIPAVVVSAGAELHPAEAWAEPPPFDPAVFFAAYPLTFRNSAHYVWSITHHHRALIALAIPGILLAWMVVAAWWLTASILVLALRDEEEGNGIRWLLNGALERPLIGVAVGAAEVLLVGKLILAGLGG